MAQINLHFGSYGEPCTVSEMRRKLGAALAGLDGNQQVTFTFQATLENYRTTSKPRTLEAPYSLAPMETIQSIRQEEETQEDGPFEIWDVLIPEKPRLTGFGIFATAKLAHKFLDEFSTEAQQGFEVRKASGLWQYANHVFGKLARPTND